MSIEVAEQIGQSHIDESLAPHLHVVPDSESNPTQPSQTVAKISRERVETPLARAALFYNQPSPYEQPPMIVIVDRKTIVLDGVKRVLSQKERAIFNALIKHRAQDFRSQAVQDAGYPKQVVEQNTRSDISVNLKRFRAGIKVGEHNVLITEGIRGGAKHTLNKDILTIDKRAGQKVPKAPKKQRKSLRRKRAKVEKSSNEITSTRQNPYLDLTRPFVDMKLAQETVPDVFDAPYDDSDKSKDRLALHAMVKANENDPRPMSRLLRAYGTGKKLPPIELFSAAALETYTEQQLEQYRLLQAHEEKALARTMKIGVAAFKRLKDAPPDEQTILQELVSEGNYAYQALFNLNLRLVRSQAIRFAHFYPHLQEIDVRQYGYNGLQSAIEKFDETKGFRFSTYAMNWIKQSIQRGLDDDGRIVRLPSHAGQAVRRIDRARSELYTKLERQPTDDEVMVAARVTKEEMGHLQRFGGSGMTSINQKIGGDGNTELGELLSDGDMSDKRIDDISNRAVVQELFKSPALDDFEKVLLSLHFEILMDSLIDIKLPTIMGELAYAELPNHIEACGGLSRLLMLSRPTMDRIISSALARLKYEADAHLELNAIA